MNETKESDYISIRKASKITGLHPHTLRKISDEKKINSYKTFSGQRKFNKSDLEKMCNGICDDGKVENHQRKNFIYTRVSSKKQLDDLPRQLEFIKSKREEYLLYESISDIASGINFKRKGLSTILDACISKTIGELVIAHRDRLCRFGYELIKLIVEKSGGHITVIDDEKCKSSEQELSEDLLSIIHIYSCRQMGKKSYKVRTANKISENTITTE
jgi:predicted site-specific integrase-resolvase